MNRHRLKEIARQSGVSLATVDRALHGRGGVHPKTAARVADAMAELDRQSDGAGLEAARLVLDLVIEAPDRFTRQVVAAFEAAAKQMRPVAIRLRIHSAERFDPSDRRRLLQTIRRRGTQGLILKLPDRGDVVGMANRLANAGVPVVTLVTDIPALKSTAYVGMDNRAAGRIAAHIFATARIDAGSVVLTVISSRAFEGEVERLAAFRAQMPAPRVIEIEGGMGRYDLTYAIAEKALAGSEAVDAVYSVGGGNRAILAALRARGYRPRLYLGHDLDHENTALLRAGEIDFVIHHNLTADARAALQHILKSHRLLPRGAGIDASRIEVATPYNVD